MNLNLLISVRAGSPSQFSREYTRDGVSSMLSVQLTTWALRPGPAAKVAVTS